MLCGECDDRGRNEPVIVMIVCEIDSFGIYSPITLSMYCSATKKPIGYRWNEREKEVSSDRQNRATNAEQLYRTCMQRIE
jgi:hypothetical protein